MDSVVQWATILSPIIAVVIAVAAAIMSARDTNRKIDSIKELTRLQINVSILEMEKELSIARHRYVCALDKSSKDLDEGNDNYEYLEEFYSNQVSLLDGCVKKLENLKQNLR